MDTTELLRRAKAAAPALALLSSDKKNRALLRMADALIAHTPEILAANDLDVEAAKDTIGAVMTDRLKLTERRISDMAEGIREVAALPDPVGEKLEEFTRPNGLCIERVSVPLGVVGIIYESRPNVTSDAAALAFKSGNVCVLKGGKEAYRTAKTVVDVLRTALKEEGLPEDFINMPEDTTRAAAQTMMTAVGLVDVLIPRGGAGLIRSCVENARIPCIQTGTGICHVYVDEFADLDKSLSVVENAKTSRPSVCNAEEVLLVHEKVAEAFLPRLYERLVTERKKEGKIPVEFRLCPLSQKIVPGTPAGETDFDTEFLDYILAVKIVKSAEEAISHIAAHSTHHSEAVMTENAAVAEAFLRAVDSACVYHNCSTRFTDGGMFGKGCEIGISTQKMHARGPMGLKELTSYKYLVRGNGQIR